MVWRALAAEHDNFHFHLALSEPLDDDNWSGPAGFIHEVVHAQYLESHPNPRAIEFHLCGPPMMIKACTKMLEKLGVDPDQIAFDEFYHKYHAKEADCQRPVRTQGQTPAHAGVRRKHR